MHDDAERGETHAGEPGDLPLSRRRFLELGAAWAVGCGEKRKRTKAARKTTECALRAARHPQSAASGYTHQGDAVTSRGSRGKCGERSRPKATAEPVT